MHKGGARRRRTWAWIACGGVLIAALALLDVHIIWPRIAVQWSAEIAPVDRAALERRYDLRNGEFAEGTTWQYDLGNRSRENIGALVHDPAARDTGYIDRDALTARPREVHVTIRPFPYPFHDYLEGPQELLLLQSSVWLLIGGAAMLRAAGAASEFRRRNTAVATLLLVGVVGCALPISPSLVQMGDANQSVETRRNFGNYAAVDAVRFEAHLSYAILGRLDKLFGATDASPARAQITLAHAATLWFVICALAIGYLERWSSMVLRYLGLVLLAPATLLYFGWREVGYMSLNVAAFPLLARGLRDGNWRLEGGSALAGLGAAMHGWGLVSLAGAWVAALVAHASPAERVRRALRVAAWGTAAYTGWVAVYVIVLKLPIITGHVGAIPWRPWFVSGEFDGRLNPAIFSAAGGRLLLMTGWVVGAPLLAVAASLWRQHRDEMRAALGYAVPSVMMTTLVLHSQGLNEDIDVVFAVFPAMYALAWVCAQDLRRTKIAAALLITAHYAFWYICLDPRFANAPLH